jgi:hypothetical protein
MKELIGASPNNMSSLYSNRSTRPGFLVRFHLFSRPVSHTRSCVKLIDIVDASFLQGVRRDE